MALQGAPCINKNNEIGENKYNSNYRMLMPNSLYGGNKKVNLIFLFIIFMVLMHSNIRHKLEEIAENDDREAFNEIFKFYYPGMVSYAKTLVHNREVALDLIQELFLNLWKNRKTITSINNLSTYLYTSLKFNAQHYMQSPRIKAETFLDENYEILSLDYLNPEDIAVQKENLKTIEETINSLPAKCRLIFRLIKEEGLKYKDVANLLGISVKTVANHMTLAHTRLIECLSEFFPEKMRNNSGNSKAN